MEGSLPVKQRILFFLYILVSLEIFLYSYTQVDLNLTLSRSSVWQIIQKSFQNIGYFRRDISSGLFVGLLTSLTVLYIWAVGLARFTGVEPWLSFMHWTHLPSAYTPLWILLSLPPYLFGFGVFLLTMWNMKLLFASFYLLTTFMIGKILGREDHKNKFVGMTIFALNPLILIEGVVSPHNDIVMMGIAMVAWYYRSWLALAASVGLKLMTATLFPVFGNRKWALFAMLAGLLFVIRDREVLPWYWVWIMPFVALLPRSRNLFIISLGVSIGLLLRYLPYLYLGNWDPPAPEAKLWLTLIPIGITAIISIWHEVAGSFSRSS